MTEAERFLAYVDASPIRETVALTGHPFLGAADIPFATTWLPSLDTPENVAFVSGYGAAFGAVPGVYAMLGYESGLALSGLASGSAGFVAPAVSAAPVAPAASAAPAAPVATCRPTRAQIIEALATASPVGPRGPVHLSTQPITAPQPVYLCRGTAVLERLDETTPEDPVFDGLRTGAVGWANPYLCV